MKVVSSPLSKREQLIEIAGSLFYRQGFGATGVQQIINEAGIAKGTFYSHFTSKEDVGVAWLQSRHVQWNEALQIAGTKARKPKGKILGLFDLLENWMNESNFRGCAFLNSLAELPQSEGAMRDEITKHKLAICDYVIELACSHFADRPKAYGEQKGKVIFLLFEAALVEGQNVRAQWPVEVARKEVKAMLSS